MFRKKKIEHDLERVAVEQRYAQEFEFIRSKLAELQKLVHEVQYEHMMLKLAFDAAITTKEAKECQKKKALKK